MCLAVWPRCALRHGLWRLALLVVVVVLVAAAVVHVAVAAHVGVFESAVAGRVVCQAADAPLVPPLQAEMSDVPWD